LDNTQLDAIAEFERDLIKDRTAEGRERAKVQGKHMEKKGRSVTDVKKALKLYDERESNGLSVNYIVRMTGVPRSTIYAKIKEEE
jgi:DNA invertase Pin-like site-specific DNA recombinase